MISSNSSVTNLFLILQNYLRPFEQWRPPPSLSHSANQNVGTTKLLSPSGEKGCLSNENAGFPDTTNTT